MVEFTLWDIFRNLLIASQWTLVLSAIAFVGGGFVGAVFLVARLWRPAVVAPIFSAYVQLFQGTPLLMQLFMCHFGVGLFGFHVSVWVSSSLALTLYTSAFLAEIWRGCVNAIPKGQWEASSSLALSFSEQLRHIILPQALRIAIPPTVGFLVQVIKGTALASVVGFVELTRAGNMIANVTQAQFKVFACVGLMYFVICYPVSLFARHLERKTHASQR